MKRNQIRSYFAIITTLLAALILNMLPLPTWFEKLRPEWLVLALLYWSIALPHRIGLSIVWCVGLLVDVLGNSVLGEHAFALTLIVYLAMKIHRQVRVFPLWQQALCLFPLLLAYELVILLIRAMLGSSQQVGWFWLPALSSAILWPWIFVLLRDYRHRLHVD